MEDITAATIPDTTAAKSIPTVINVNINLIWNYLIQSMSGTLRIKLWTIDKNTEKSKCFAH